MNDSLDFKNSKVVIYNEDCSVELARTVVSSFDKNDTVITVPRGAFSADSDGRISALLFHPDGLFEYKGTIRKNTSPPGYYDIALYKGKVKENRVAMRYKVNAPAIVEKYVIINKLVPLRAPLHVLVLNVSTNGCLIQASAKLLNIGTTFQFQMEFSDSVVSFYAKVVRSKSVSREESEFGCKFAPPLS